MVFGSDQQIQFVRGGHPAFVVGFLGGGAGRRLHKGRLGDVVHRQLPGFILRPFRGQAAQQDSPGIGRRRRLALPRPVQGHGRQLAQKGVPGVALMRPQRGKGIYFVRQQPGIGFRQGYRNGGPAGQVHPDNGFGQDVEHRLLLAHCALEQCPSKIEHLLQGCQAGCVSRFLDRSKGRDGKPNPRAFRDGRIPCTASNRKGRRWWSQWPYCNHRKRRCCKSRQPQGWQGSSQLLNFAWTSYKTVRRRIYGCPAPVEWPLGGGIL